MDALPHEHSNLEVDTLTDSKPVELSQDRSDVFSTGRAANQTSSGVLDGLKALQVDATLHDAHRLSNSNGSNSFCAEDSQYNVLITRCCLIYTTRKISMFSGRTYHVDVVRWVGAIKWRVL